MNKLRNTMALAVTAAITMLAAATNASAAAPAAPFTQCPAVGLAPSCGILIVVNADRSVSVLGDPAVGDYDGGDDTLVGVLNQSSQPVQAITVSGAAGSDLGGFDGDGLCAYGVACGSGPTGYEGPGTSFVNDPATTDRVEVDFAGAGLAAGTSTYFGLEGTLNAASLVVRQGGLAGKLILKTSVTLAPIVPDPGTAAYVLLKITATNADGTPAANAALQLSNANPGVVFHTNSAGVLTLTEPVNLASGAGPAASQQVTVTGTSTSGATATATQPLWAAQEQVSCSFAGRPGADLTLLDAMLPGSAGAVQTLIENFAPYVRGLHTDAVGYIAQVPGDKTFYAQTVKVTTRTKTLYDDTGFGTKIILNPPKGWYEAVTTGCVALGPLA